MHFQSYIGFNAVFITCSLLLAIYLPNNRDYVSISGGFPDSIGFLVHPTPKLKHAADYLLHKGEPFRGYSVPGICFT
jgi:hypothetical protein